MNLNPFSIWKKNRDRTAYSEAVLSMADYLIAKGFTPEDAMKEAKNFWNKHHGKIKDVL